MAETHYQALREISKSIAHDIAEMSEAVGRGLLALRQRRKELDILCALTDPTHNAPVSSGAVAVEAWTLLQRILHIGVKRIPIPELQTSPTTVRYCWTKYCDGLVRLSLTVTITEAGTLYTIEDATKESTINENTEHLAVIPDSVKTQLAEMYG